MCAASNGFVDTVKALLDAKASAAETNKEGRNSLHIAGEEGRDKRSGVRNYPPKVLY